MNEHLYRSRDDRMIAGVAGGLAEIWDADPSVIRIVWALLVVLTGGIALVVYIVMAIVVPEEAAVPVAPSSAAASMPLAAAGAVATATPSAAPVDARSARRAARAARREARHARGGDRTAGIVIGALLIVIGGVFFLQQWLPDFDFDWFWPLMLVGLGILLLVVGFTRDTHSGGSDR